MVDRVPSALSKDVRFARFLEVWDTIKGLLPQGDKLNIYDVQDVSESALYDLAATFGVLGHKGWLLATSSNSRREIILAAIGLHKRAGTSWSVTQSLKAAGYPNCRLVEGVLQPGGIVDPLAIVIELDSQATIDVAAVGVPATVRDLMEKVVRSWLPIYVRLDSITVRIVIKLDGSRPLNGTSLLNGLPG